MGGGNFKPNPNSNYFTKEYVTMAEIKINQLNTPVENSAEMIDLRGEAGTNNSAAFKAFTSLRGGQGKPVWALN